MSVPALHRSFCFQDGKGYVAEDGNHRACIAKFFLYAQPSPLLHGVHLVEVQTDARNGKPLLASKKGLLPPVLCRPAGSLAGNGTRDGPDGA